MSTDVVVDEHVPFAVRSNIQKKGHVHAGQTYTLPPSDIATYPVRTDLGK